MRCFDPKLCFRVHGKRIWRHFTFWQNSVMLRGKKPDLVTNCGQCLICRKRRAMELAARCVLHSSLYKQNSFITLTYDETREGYHNKENYPDIQLFKKRLRAYCWRKFKKRIEAFNVHEYGKNGKKHWHLIVFNHDFSCKPYGRFRVPEVDRKIYTIRNGIPLFTSERLEELWPFGFSTIGDVSEASAMYQAQYMEKDFKNGNLTNGKKSKSRHSGLGGPYFKQQYRQILQLGYVPFSGRKMPLPRYFEKIAHKHYCHFYEPSAFHDNGQRRAPYRPFKPGTANKEIADLFIQYKAQKLEKQKELEEEFDSVISLYIDTKDTPDFIKSGSNAMYDQLKNLTEERF